MDDDRRDETPRDDAETRAAGRAADGDETLAAGGPAEDEPTRSPGGPEDEEATRLVPGAQDEEATRLVPGVAEQPGEETTAPGEDELTSIAPPGEPPTRVLPGASAARATATPPGPPGAAPPAGTPPPLGGLPSGGAPAAPAARRGGGRPPRWLWFALAGVAAGLALAAAFVLLTRGPDAQPFVGTWGPTTDGRGPLGGLVIEDHGGELVVTVFSAAIERVDTVTATWDGDALAAVVGDAQPLVGVAGPATLHMAREEKSDHLVVTIASGAGTAVQRLARVSSLAPGPAETAPAPAATPTQTPTATPTATASPEASPTPTTSPDDQVRSGLTAIQVGVLTWASGHGGLFPPVSEVSAGGEVGALVDPWPTNPFTGAAMQTGTAAGDYSYEQLDAGRAYRLTAYLGDGSTVVLP